MRTLFNVAYSPENNAIEIFWSLVKKRYKKLRLDHILRGIKFECRELIIEALGSVN